MSVGEIHQKIEVEAHPNVVNTESAELTQRPSDTSRSISCQILIAIRYIR
jgi:hypothetical protein